MKPVLIVENSTSSLIRENSSTKNKYVLGGTFTEFGVKNRNERIYTADKFLPALNELNERMSSLGAVYGEFDHPDVFDTSLARASHVIKKAEYIKEQNLVSGEIQLLSTYWGKEAKALVDDGCPVFVSSRAAGITESDGSVSLKKLFTYDIVADPGFASAKMSVKVLNESLGYNPQSNFRIYEMSDESKINQLFNMNNNDFVTKKQLTDYSKYLVNEIASTKKEVKSAISKGNMNPKKLEQLLEYYEELNSTNSQVVKYLDYLAEKVQIIVNENKNLRTTTDKLIKHNDYLAENLEKAINYTEYVAENLDKNIEYSEYLAENLDRNISYSEYIAENLDKNISYSEYLAENLDKSINYQGMIVEKLNSGKINESAEDAFPSLSAAGFDNVEDEDDNNDDNAWNQSHDDDNDDNHDDDNYKGISEVNPSHVHAHEDDNNNYDNEDNEESHEIHGHEDSELSESINKLIEEAKKRKVSETTDLNFLKFLNKSQVDSFYALADEEQESVKLHINERSYFTQKEVLSLIAEALSTKNESLEERVIRLMPENVKPIWEQLTDSGKKSILSQARLYPEEVLMTESQVEHFWSTRNLKKNESVTKKLVSHESIIQEDKLSDKEAQAILERFKTI